MTHRVGDPTSRPNRLTAGTHAENWRRRRRQSRQRSKSCKDNNTTTSGRKTATEWTKIRRFFFCSKENGKSGRTKKVPHLKSTECISIFSLANPLANRCDKKCMIWRGRKELVLVVPRRKERKRSCFAVY